MILFSTVLMLASVKFILGAALPVDEVFSTVPSPQNTSLAKRAISRFRPGWPDATIKFNFENQATETRLVNSGWISDALTLLQQKAPWLKMQRVQGFTRTKGVLWITLQCADSSATVGYNPDDFMTMNLYLGIEGCVGPANAWPGAIAHEIAHSFGP